jgi:serine/threonine protein phosphatase PrpC
MGGHAAGEQAAAIALERIRARLERATDTPELRLREAIALANNAIYKAAQAKPEWRGMACVLTAAVVSDGEVTVGHVGDSRLYKIRGGVMEKVTRDHSPVGEREDSGELAETEAMRHPRRNEVFRDVGSEEHAPDDPDFIDVFHFAFEPDSAVLLCSDGLSDVLHSREILRLVEENARDPLSVVQSLISAATPIGHDNVSVVFVEGETFAETSGRERVAAFGDERETERTDPLPVISMKAARGRWYAARTACFLYGGVIGACLALAVVQFMLPRWGTPQPRILDVTPESIDLVLESAHPGDTVVLGPGNYPETVHLKSGVNLRARQRREAVVNGSIVIEGTGHSRVEGILMHAADIGILVKNGEATLSDDEVSGANEAGVQFEGSSQGAVIGCEIHDNPGIGLAALDQAELSIRSNVISANGTASGKPRPGLLVRSAAKLLVSGNIFAGNGGEAVWLPAEDPLVDQKNAFSLGANGDKRPPIRIVAPEGNRLEGR